MSEPVDRWYVEARERVDALEVGLREAERALKANVSAWLTLEPHLSTPYPDDPRWTPWTRFGQRAADRAYEALTNVRDLLERR